MPENPSDPPHSIPAQSLDRGAATRCISLAFAMPEKVSVIARLSISRSEG